jgi:shikimate kinase
MADEGPAPKAPGRHGEESIALIGFMGSGKSTVGPLLAALLGMAHVELDAMISAAAGLSVEDIFSRAGEAGFRDLESKALREVLMEGGKVISCGGGVVLRTDNVEMLRRHCRVFFLKIAPQAAVERLRRVGGRPLLEGKDLEERVRTLMSERESCYVCAAHEIVEAGEDSPEEIAEEIAARWRRSG